MANTKEIIKQFRAKMREYYLNFEYKGISQNDDDLLDKILIELINCFSTSEEEAKKLSRKALDKEIGKYELNIFNSRLALKDPKFLEENSREKIEEIKAEIVIDKLFLNYWKSRRASDGLYWEYEVHLYLFYTWMDKFKFDDWYQRVLVSDLMAFCGYTSKHSHLERLKKQKNQLFSRMQNNYVFGEVLKYEIRRILKKDGYTESEIKKLIQDAIASRK